MNVRSVVNRILFAAAVAAFLSASSSISAHEFPPEKVAAFNVIKPTYKEFRSTCSFEKINVAMEPIRLARNTDGYVIRLSAGSCFGNMGEDDYIVGKVASRWKLLFSAVPGRLDVKPHGADLAIRLESVGQCSVTWIWQGNAYVPHPSHECQGLLEPGSVHLEAVAAKDDLKLPLTVGTYVVAEEACSVEASDARLTYTGDELNSAHVLGSLLSVSKNADLYKVRIRNVGDGGMGGNGTSITTETYKIDSAKAFTILGARKSTYRWCNS